MSKSYFVTATGTDCGKTLVSTILCLAMNKGYWKPVQSGQPTDTDWVSEHSSGEINCFPEGYLLDRPVSPHAAAADEGIEIDIKALKIPQNTSGLIIEGAGGLLVPINKSQTVADLIKFLDLEVILVAPVYLGCINHTLLTVEALKARQIPISGLIFNGPEDPISTGAITERTGLPVWFHLPRMATTDFPEIQAISKKLKLKLASYL